MPPEMSSEIKKLKRKVDVVKRKPKLRNGDCDRESN